MILIYGNENCNYCIKAKEFLTLNKIPYLYISLSDIYTNDTWRNAFKDIKSIILKQTTIPIIFKSIKFKECTEPPVFSVDGLKDFTLVGTYFDLVDLIEDVEKIDDISNNY